MNCQIHPEYKLKSFQSSNISFTSSIYKKDDKRGNLIFDFKTTSFMDNPKVYNIHSEERYTYLLLVSDANREKRNWENSADFFTITQWTPNWRVCTFWSSSKDRFFLGNKCQHYLFHNWLKVCLKPPSSFEFMTHTISRDTYVTPDVSLKITSVKSWVLQLVFLK